VSGHADPFKLVWPVDQAGYEIARVTPQEPPGLGQARECEVVRAKGGPPRYYWPLEDEALWLSFAERCTDAAGIIAFANEFGLPGIVRDGLKDRVDDIIETAALLRRIGQQLQGGDRLAATLLFPHTGLPNVKEAVFWFDDRPEFLVVPLCLRDALLHQAALAITANHRFRRCRNEGCVNWFRLGRAQPRGKPAYTARREFCSDRCRVASARRQKRKA
jgi:hypothetical protein